MYQQKIRLYYLTIYGYNYSYNIENIINNVSQWTQKPICPDTEGSQLRTGQLLQDELIVKTNDIVEMVGAGNKSSNNHDRYFNNLTLSQR